MLYLDTYSALTGSFKHSRITKTSQGLFVFVYCSFCWNSCRFATVTPLLTNVHLWIIGADIVQWLMKNLSIEDPGKPAEKSVNKCQHNRIHNRGGRQFHMSACSHITSWSHPPRESDRSPWLHLPHLWPRSDTKGWWNPLSLSGTERSAEGLSLICVSLWV